MSKSQRGSDLIDPVLARQFNLFLQEHDPGSVSRHLRCMLLDFIHDQFDPGLPPDFDKWIREFYGLFELLDVAAKHNSTI